MDDKKPFSCRWSLAAVVMMGLAAQGQSSRGQTPTAATNRRPAAVAAQPPGVIRPRNAPVIRAPRLDPAVQRASSDYGGYPTPQQQFAPPTPQMVPQSLPPAPQPVAPQMMISQSVVPAPMFNAQALVPAFNAQATPMVTQMVPVQAYSVAAQPAQAVTGNFFLPSTASAAPPMQAFGTIGMSPQPMTALAAVPVQAQAMAAVPMQSQAMVAVPVQAQATAPATANAFAMTNQTVSVPTTRSSSRVRVRGPGPIASGLARFGERLTALGRIRIETLQETELAAQAVQPTGGIATIQTTGTVPMIPPQVPAQGVPPRPPCPPPCAQPPCTQPPCPTPSPQGGSEQRHNH